MDNEKGIVITSRIRLARNLASYKFPIKMTQEEADNVIKDVNNVMNEKKSTYKLFYLKDLSDIEKNVVIENHLISPTLLQNNDKAAFL